MSIKTYNIRIDGEQEFTAFWLTLLRETRDAYNLCSDIVTAEWEEPIMPMVLTAVNEEEKTVDFSYISYRDDDVKVHSTHYMDKDTTERIYEQ